MMVAAFYEILASLCYTVYNSIKYLHWIFKTKASGKIMKLTNKNIIYDRDKIEAKSIEYTYDMEITLDGIVDNVVFIEKTNGDKESAYKEDDLVDVYVDLKNKKAVYSKYIREKLIIGPFGMALGIVAILIGMLIVSHT